MKSVRKLLSLFLSVSLLAAGIALPATAAEYPQSEHDYADNCDLTWQYEYPGDAEGLYVTFSDQTYVDPGSLSCFLDGDFTQEELQAYLAEGYLSREGDRITLYDGKGELYGWFTGDQLAGQTVYLKGGSLSVRLESDEKETGYGFSIDAIGTQLPEGFAEVVWHTDTGDDKVILREGEPLLLNPYYQMRQQGHEIIVGWETADGAAYYYDNTLTHYISSYYTECRQTDLIAESGATYEFHAITCPISMTKDEVFSFVNSDMGNSETGSYYQSREQLGQFYLDEFTTFGLTPFMPAVTILLAFHGLYWTSIDHLGSCTGIAMTELLQYHGKIDLPSRQGVATMAELEPDEDLQSIVNFYALQALPAHLVTNMAVEPGTEEYSRQLKAMFDTVAAGKPVYFEFYMGEQHPMKTIVESGPLAIGNVGHSIVLTGAYTDGNGNHILIACDCNTLNYSQGSCDIVFINADYTEIYKPMYQELDEPLRGFSWTDEVDQYDSLKAEGVPNPFQWHIAFFRHFISFFRNLLSLFFKKV